MKDSSRDIRFALVGCGKIAQKHVAAIERLERGRVVGACDVDSEKASTFGEEHAIPTFTSAPSMVDATEPDVLNVLTPSGSHTAVASNLIPLGCDLVIEKPIGLRLDSVDRLLTEAEANGCDVFVVQQNRFNPPVRKLKQAIEMGRFGQLVLGSVRVRWTRHQPYYDQKGWRGTWKGDGGVLANQASHHLDMLLWLMGNVVSVTARTATQLVDIEAEDTASAILQFENGALGIIEATTATRPRDLEGSISVLGERASVEVGGFYMNELETWNFEEDHQMDDEVWESHRTVPDIYAWNHTQFFHDVVEALATGQDPIVDGREGRKSLAVLHALYRSAETGREVQLSDRPTSAKLGRST